MPNYYSALLITIICICTIFTVGIYHAIYLTWSTDHKDFEFREKPREKLIFTACDTVEKKIVVFYFTTIDGLEWDEIYKLVLIKVILCYMLYKINNFHIKLIFAIQEEVVRVS